MKIIKATFRNNQSENFGNINIFVGANGVGKTSLLRELLLCATGQDVSSSHWVKNVEINDLNQNDAKILLSLMKEKDGVSGRELIFQRDASGRVHENAGNQWYKDDNLRAIISLSENNKKEIDEKQKAFLKNDIGLRKNLIGFEGTSTRLQLNGSPSVSDALQPKDIYNIIYNDSKFKKDLDKKFRIFDHHFYILSHRKNPIYFGVCKEKFKPSIYKDSPPEKTEKWMKENDFTFINKAGDGIHAAATLFFSLYNPILRIVLIDEPEVFIYPAQKRQIAREIKALAKKERKQIFIVTHDATFLSGLVDNIEKGEDIKIFYLKNRKELICIPFSDIGSVIKPTTKQEKYLQSLFHRGVIFSEGPNDRFFYESAMNEIYKSNIQKKDIAFIETGGASNGSMHIVRFIKDAKIKAAFIFDFDVIADKDKKTTIIDKEESGKFKGVYGILSGVKDFPELTKLHEIINTRIKLKKKKKPFFNKLGIIDKKWYSNNRTFFEAVFKKLEKVGIFIVPSGALESWAGNDDEFPYSAVKKIIDNPNLNNFKIFSDKILEFLKTEIK